MQMTDDESECCGCGLAVVLAAFLVYCIVDGVAYSFAVFYVDLLTEFSSQGHAKVVLVGTLLPATALFVGQSVSQQHQRCKSVFLYKSPAQWFFGFFGVLCYGFFLGGGL